MNERERIAYLIETFGLTPSQFADKTGIPRASVSHILGGRNKPSLEILQKVAAIFPEVNLNWLMLGVGEPPVAKKETENLSNATYPVQRESLFQSIEESAQIHPLIVQQQRNEEQQHIKQQKTVVHKQQSERTQRKTTTQRASHEIDNTKRIKEIRVFYSDGTFEILFPEKP